MLLRTCVVAAAVAMTRRSHEFSPHAPDVGFVLYNGFPFTWDFPLRGIVHLQASQGISPYKGFPHNKGSPFLKGFPFTYRQATRTHVCMCLIVITCMYVSPGDALLAQGPAVRDALWRPGVGQAAHKNTDN